MAGATGTFMHGVTTAELPTALTAPILADAGINVVIGTAPTYQVTGRPTFVNRPRLYNDYASAVTEMGYSDDWETFTICEHMDAAFRQYGVRPVVYINVFDPEIHIKAVAPAAVNVVRGQAVLPDLHIIPSSLDVKNQAGTTTYVLGTDFAVEFNNEGKLVLSTFASIGPTATLQVGYDVADTSLITKADIIGGIDVATGQARGIEAIEDVFLRYNVVPNILIVPKWSQDPEVASVMVAKMERINGCFVGIAVCDVDDKAVQNPIDVPDWMDTNNYVFDRQVTCFPMIGLTSRVYHQATQLGPLMAFTDARRGGNVPYYSPSNKNYRMNKLLANGNEIDISKANADYLNANGCVTALNFIGGWRAWGNRTSIYPASSDVKDVFIPQKRMNDFIRNTLVLSVWQYVDEPGNLRLIDAIVNSMNSFLNGLKSVGALLGARVEFLPEENPRTELLAGHYTFRVSQASPPPAEWIHFNVIFDVSYLDVLFEGVSAAAA